MLQQALESGDHLIIFGHRLQAEPLVHHQRGLVPALLECLHQGIAAITIGIVGGKQRAQRICHARGRCKLLFNQRLMLIRDFGQQPKQSVFQTAGAASSSGSN